MENSSNPTSNVGGAEGGGEATVIQALQNMAIPPNPVPAAAVVPIQEQILELKPSLMSSDVVALRHATRAIKTLLSAQNPPIQETIDAGLTPVLVNLSSHPDDEIQFMSLWALSNLASGNSDQTRIVVEHGALEVFKQRLGDGVLHVRDQAVWGIGNIAGDSVELRNVCLENGVMPLVLEMLTSSSLNSKRLAAWTVSNLCRGKPEPNRDDVRSCIPVMVECLKNELDNDLLSDSLWCLSYLTGCGDESEVEVFETGVVPCLLQKMRAADRLNVLVPALRVLGNFSSGPDHHVDYLIEHGFLNDLQRLMKIKKMMKEAYWTVSNILGGTTSQNTAAMVLMPDVLKFIVTPVDNSTLKEALWCLYNALANCSSKGFELLLSYQPQQAIFAFLETPSYHAADRNLYSCLTESIHKVANKLFNEEQLAKFKEL